MPQVHLNAGELNLVEAGLKAIYKLTGEHKPVLKDLCQQHNEKSIEDLANANIYELKIVNLMARISSLVRVEKEVASDLARGLK